MGDDAQTSEGWQVKGKVNDNWRKISNKGRKVLSNRKISKFDRYLRNNGKNMAVKNNGDVHKESEVMAVDVHNGVENKRGGTNTNESAIMKECVNERVCIESEDCGNKENNVISNETNKMVDENLTNVESVKHDFGGMGNGKEDRILYSKEHRGDVAVLVDTSKIDADNKKVRNGLYLFERIRDCGFKGIDDIKAIGRTLYRVRFSNVSLANKFVLDRRLGGRDLRAFIPRSYIETYGVIRDVPLYLSDEDILANVKSSVHVTYVRRFTRKERGSGEQVRTYSVKIGFAGTEVPEDVILNYTRLKVDMFYPAVKQCHNCGRLGHTRKGCRSKQRCLVCGKEGVCQEACGSSRCLLCGQTDHRAFERSKCPKWNREEELNKIMTVKKMSKGEVLSLYGENRDNRFGILDEAAFPELGNGSVGNTRNGDREVNRILTPRSYSTVARSRPVAPKIIPHFERPRRMFEEQVDKTPVFDRKGYEKVSEMEKLMTEILKFMKDHFTKVANPIGIEAVGHFERRVNKMGLDMDHQVITGIVNVNDENITI